MSGDDGRANIRLHFDQSHLSGHGNQREQRPTCRVNLIPEWGRQRSSRRVNRMQPCSDAPLHARPATANSVSAVNGGLMNAGQTHNWTHVAMTRVACGSHGIDFVTWYLQSRRTRKPRMLTPSSSVILFATGSARSLARE